jgi:hypothetical protein
MAQLKPTWPSEDEYIRPKYQVQLSDNLEETVTITHVVHTIRMGDVEDPDLFVAQPIYEWQQTEQGKWIMENSNPTPSWHRQVDYTTYGHIYQIRAYLTHKQLTFWKLKYE